MLAALVALVRRARAGVRPARRAHAGALLVLMLAAAAGAGSHVALAQPARLEVESFALGGGRALEVEALVVGKVESRPGGEWIFDARASRLTTGAAGEAVQVEVTVRVQPEDVDDPHRLDVGAEIIARGTARPAAAGDRAVLTVSATRGVEVMAAPTGMLAVAADLRRGLVRASARLPGAGAGLIPGLAVGDTSAVTAALDTAMKQSSLSHLTAVSGANCAIVVGLAFGAVAAAGGSRRARVAAGLGALGGFVLLVTPEPSVVRAGTMAAIAMLGVLLGRTGVGMAVLCVSVTALLVADPWLSGSLGFALSVVATASLLLFARPLAAGLARWMPRALALALSIPLAAQLACGPLLVVISPTVPVYGVVANLLVAPAAPIATIVGLAACLAAPLPWLQSGLAALTWLPASWIAATAQTFSSLPGAQLPWLEGWPGAAVLGAVSLAVGLLVGVRRDRSRCSRAVRTTSGLVLAVVVGAAAGSAALGSAAGRWTIPASWSVLACDVGQGDAVLVRSGEAIALIDTGPDPAQLRACLSQAGVDRIDLLVLTHFDLDHIGGLDAVIGRAAVALHGPAVTADASRALAALREGGARLVPASAGRRGSLGQARWRVLWPPAQSRAFASGNDASVVLDVRGGAVASAVFLGDLSAAPQAALVASGVLRPPYDVVKVAHHGSADQDPALYEHAAARLALLTVGAENTYGHPRPETLAVLHSAGARIARTDRHGLVAVWRAGGDLHVWRENAVAGPG